MTAVAEDLDIERWVTFSGDTPRPQCERGSDCSCHPRCPLEALWRLAWRMTCPHPAQRLLCDPHRAEVLELAAPRMTLDCPYCGAEAALIAVESLR